MHATPWRAARRASAALILSIAPVVLIGCNEANTANSDAAGEANDKRPTATAAVQLPDDEALKARIDDVLQFTSERQLVAGENAAWQVVHGILAFGPDLQMKVDGEPKSALRYLLDGGQLTGWILRPGEKGVDTVVEAGSKTGQGHEDQWLGYLSLCGIPLDETINVGGGEYNVGDLLSQAQWDVRDGMEATWTLMALAAYVPTDTKWPARDGTEWSVGRVVGMEAGQDLTTSACGGTHRLVGLTSAVNRRIAEGQPIEGPWKLAQDKIDDAVAMARDFQQPDGAFSANYFQRASGTAEIGQRISTTGHTLEFLALTLSDQELSRPWVARSVVALCDMLEQTRDFDLECGGLYHAARGLQVYRARRFGGGPMVGQPQPAGSARRAAPNDAAAR